MGRTVKEDFGTIAYSGSFKFACHMVFLGLNGGCKGVTDSVRFPTIR